MKKKLLSLILALSILVPGVSLIAPSAYADTECKINGIIYTLDEQNHIATVTNHEGELTDIVIPSTISSGEESYTVTSIGRRAFSGCIGLTSVTIQKGGVTSIGAAAFADCTNLTSVNIPEGVTSLNGFANCTGLTSITIPGSVTSIGYAAFADCTGLTSITIPGSVTSIGERAFEGCTSLTSVIIQEGVKSIGLDAFRTCTSLTSVILPESLESMDEGAFKYCSNLTSINIPDGVKSIGRDAFVECKFTSINIPEGVTNIGPYTFSKCSNLTSINIPGRVESIGYNAFYECTSLTRVVLPESLKSIDDNAFSGCSSLTSITLPNGITSIGEAGWTFAGCTSLTSIEIPGSVKRIPQDIFNGCSNLTEVTISEGSKYIIARAFKNCTSLAKITIPNSVESISQIGESAFEGCSSLATIKIPCDFDKSKFDKDNGITINSDGTGYSIKDTDLNDGKFELMHNYKDTIIQEPTDDQVGIVEHRCTHCEDSYRTNIIKEGSNPSLMPDGSKISDSAPKAEAEVTTAEGETITTALQDPLGVLGDNVTLNSTLVEDEESVENCYKLIETLEGQGTIKNVQILEMVPYVNGGEKHGQLDGMVRLMFKVPNGWDKNNTKVVLIDQDADISDEDRIFDSEIETIDGEDYIVIYTDHFSQYALVEMATDEDEAATSEVSDTSNTSSVKTGDNAPILALSILISVCALAIVMIERKNSQNI